MRFIKDYMRDETLRHELNALTQEVFGFDFEGWVTGGYFEGDYIPYSYEEDGQLLANVSVNRMDFLVNGVEKHFIQLGTVMTKEAERGKGYAAQLLQHALTDYEDKCDGIYLFGNLSALGFYDKQGFRRMNQYRYRLKEDVRVHVQQTVAGKAGADCFRQADASRKEKYQAAVRRCAANAAMEQMNKYGLQMFYTAGMDDVYYSEALDCYVVIEQEDDTLYLQSIICERNIALAKVLEHIPLKYRQLVLGFVPCAEDKELFEAELYDGAEDYRVFYRGEAVAEIEKRKLYFPVLSHA